MIQLYTRLWRDWLAHKKKALAFIMVILLASAGVTAAFPLVVRMVFNGLSGATIAPAFVISMIALIMLTLGIRAATSYLQTLKVNGLAFDVKRDFQKAMTGHLLYADFAITATQSSGQFISRLINDVNLLYQAVVDLVTNLLKSVLTVAALFVTLLWIDWLLTLIVTAFYPLVFKPVIHIGKRQREKSKHRQIEIGNATGAMVELIQASRMIRAYKIEEKQQHRAHGIFDQLFLHEMKVIAGRAKINPLFEFMAGIVLSVIVVVVAWRITSGSGQVGDLAGFVTATLFMVDALRRLATINATAHESAAALQRIFGLLDIKPHITSPPDPIALTNPQGVLAVEGVAFGYNATPVITDIEFTAKPSQVVAIVGPSGAGKTTIINLIPRLFDTDGGRITVDGYDIRDLALGDLRDSIALVSQEATLFDDTIANNIRIGRLDASDAEVMEAAKSAAAHDFIIGFGDGYDTIVGEGGNRLSGGQKQRIAIARAILKDAPILLMDEATSALDAESEGQIWRSIARIADSKTVVVVAHRLATIQKADNIIVMDGGRIVEQGTHPELLAKNGLYAQLSALQRLDD